MNLLKETIEDIAASGHTPADIVFIGSRNSGHCCTWAEFCVIADREYDNDYGAQEVADDLEIVFSDGSNMWRHEYDGSEHWSYSVPFVEPANKLPIKNLFVDQVGRIGWASLAELNAQEPAR